MDTKRSTFIEGVKAIAPILVGTVPFAMISGVLALEVGLTPLMAVAMSFVVYAGASQLAALQLIAASAPVIIVILTGIVINLRFLMYSSSIAPHLNRTPAVARAFLAGILTDQAYAVSITRYLDGLALTLRPWFYFGAALAFYITWQFSAVAGILLGASVPATWGLDFAIPLTFMVLIIPNLRDRAAVIVLIVTGFLTILLKDLPLNLSLIVSAVIGISVGAVYDAQSERRVQE